MSKQNLWKLNTIVSACLMLAACGGSSDSLDGTGRLSVSITDAPIHDAQSVIVNFLGAEVKPADGPALRFYFCKDPDYPDVAKCNAAQATVYGYRLVLKPKPMLRSMIELEV